MISACPNGREEMSTKLVKNWSLFFHISFTVKTELILIAHSMFVYILYIVDLPNPCYMSQMMWFLVVCVCVCDFWKHLLVQ